ncbi:MAG: threonine aldolase [Gammaproteobacteria bacterium]|jgi:threonine aldolase
MSGTNSISEFRSDTFTLPDAGMRKAIYNAEVGNAGYGEDPSVNKLEKTMAAFFGCDGAVFLPSATMANQIAISAWTRPGDMVVLEEFGHSYYFETGAMSAIAGAQAHLLHAKRGILQPEDIADRITHPENPYARTGLIVLENTSNFGGGTIYPQKTLDAIFKLATKNKLPVHIDGARIWNVLAATKSEPNNLVQPEGSLSVCFSKGLGAPMGAALLGNTDFIHEARRTQQMLGGAMRQIGFMAAAALYSFENNRERLKEDHENALFLANALSNTDGINVDLEGVQTNIIYVEVVEGASRASALVTQLDDAGIRTLNVGPRIRFVTSMLVTRDDCKRAANIFEELLSKD